MKKLTIFTVLLIFLGIANAQSQEPVVTWDGLIKQKEKSDADILNAKKNTKSATWAKRADIYYNIHTFEIAGLYKGLPATGNGIQNAEYLIDKPGKKSVSGDMEIWEYNRKKLIFKNGILDSWEQTEFIDKNALQKSAEALLKAVEVDEKGKFKDKSTTKDLLAMIKSSIINDAITLYSDALEEKTKNDNKLNESINKKFKDSYKLMEYGYNLCELPKNSLDTIYKLNQIGYFMGVIAYNDKSYKKAKSHFEKSIENDHLPGASYHYLAECYAGMGDSTTFISKVKEGFDKYPDDEQLIIDLINYYMAKNQLDEAVEYIDIALAKNPDNPSYYSAKATIYDNATDKMNDEYKKYMEESYDHKKEAFRERNNPTKLKAAESKRDETLNKALEVVKNIEENLNKAEKLYNESLEVDPKFFNAAYNLGRIYLKRNDRNALHADYILKIYLKKDFKKSAEFENLAKEQLRIAAEKFEVASKINPNDIDLLKVLKIFYFILRDTENQKRIEELINNSATEEIKID